MNFEHAVVGERRHVALALRRMKSIRAGIQCERCTRAQARSLVAGQVVCRECGDILALDREVARQKAERAAMTRRARA
jgi:ribosomal protein S27E